MGAAWAFVATAHGGRPYFEGLQMQIWTEYANYILESFVMGMLNCEDGGFVGSEDWEVILGYDQEIRRNMVQRMLEGEPLPTALRTSWNCSLVKDRYFVAAL